MKKAGIRPLVRTAAVLCTAIFAISLMPQSSFAQTTYVSYSEDLSNGYIGYRMKEAGTDNEGNICYCYQHENKQPPMNTGTAVLPNYVKEDYMTTTDTQADCGNARAAIAAVLFAGYPTDGCGYAAQYGISVDDARTATQNAVWAISGGEDLSTYNTYSEPYSEYYLALMCYAAKNSSYYGQSAALSLSGSTQLNMENGVWKTGGLSINGIYKGKITLPSSSDMAFFDSSTNAKVTAVKTGQSFYAKYIGTAEPTGTYEMSAAWKTARTNDFYATDDLNAEQHVYQDMVSMLPQENTLSLNIVKDVPASTANIVFSKTAVGGTSELGGAALKVVKGEGPDGEPVASWRSSETAKTITLDRGKTYTMVETEAPDGYDKAESITFHVMNDGSVGVKTFRKAGSSMGAQPSGSGMAGTDETYIDPDHYWKVQTENMIHMEDAQLTSAAGGTGNTSSENTQGGETDTVPETDNGSEKVTDTTSVEKDAAPKAGSPAKKDSTIPRTGDQGHVIMYASVFMITACLLGYLGYRKRIR